MRLTLRTALVAAVAAATAVTGSVVTAQAAPTRGDHLVPVVEGLDGPRGLALGPANRIVYAEADGTVSERVGAGKHAGRVRALTQVPAGFIAPAVDMAGRGETFILTAGGEPGSGAATLYRWTPGKSGARPVADIQAYQQSDPDPDDLEGEPTTSNPFGVAALGDGTALVADAEGNELLRVWPNGDIVTVARLKPRVVEVPDGYPPEAGLPPAGTPIPSEAVATSVTVGADGYYYVGELRGFPATPGTSQVWRIAPGSVDATCDPEAPDTGPCQRYADGFTSIADLGADRHGNIYVVELAKASWLAMELGVGSPTGGLYRIPAGGGGATELAADQLMLPGGVDTDNRGRVYVSGPIFGEGAIARVG